MKSQSAFSNYHTHTTFCDGSDCPEELVLEAIRLGCPEIGFSGHSHLREDTGSMTEEGTRQYRTEIRRLKEKYKGSIRILLGIEQDVFSAPPVPGDYDYIIGAVHYVEKNGTLYPVDESRESFLHTAETVFHGDYYAFAEDYYRTVSEVPQKTDCDIIAHFDLFTKYNEGDALFDTLHPRYIAASDAALQHLLRCGAVLEMNTGAMARGYRSKPYPQDRILLRWLDAGGKVILSSDCHDRRFLLFGFEELAEGFPRPEQLLRTLPI